MNHFDALSEHLAPLAAPLPAPSTMSTRRPRIDAEVIDAMAAARVRPLPRKTITGTTPDPGFEPAQRRLMNAYGDHRGRLVMITPDGEVDPVAEAWKHAMPPKLWRPWHSRVNWGFAALLACLFSMAFALGRLIGSLL